MLHSNKVYGLWACIAYGSISAASTSSTTEPHRMKIYSTSVATCASKVPATFAGKLYYISPTGIASIRLPRDKGEKSEPKEIISFEFPEQPISALAIDAKAEKFFIGSGSQLGEIYLGRDCHVLDGSNDPEPDWHRPADSIDFYKQDRFAGLASPISALCLAVGKELMFSASADRICRWSTRTCSLTAVQVQTSAPLAMAVYDDALVAVHANGDLQSVPLERDVPQHNATFGGKAMRIAAFDEPEKILYAVSQDGKLHILDTRALKVTHTADIKTTGMPTALATKNHGVFVGDDQGAIKFYDTRKIDGSVGRVTAAGAMQRQLWYDRAKHNLVSLSADNVVRRYWME